MLKGLLALLLLASQLSFAHGGHGDSHHHHGPPLSEEGEKIGETMDIFHDAINGAHEDHGRGIKAVVSSLVEWETWKGFGRGLNPIQIGANTFRAYYMGAKNKDRLEMAQDFVLLFPASHGLEMIFGPSLGIVAHHFGLGDALSTGLGALGGIIAIPGVDPLCYLLYAGYIGSSKVRYGVSFVRKGAVWVGFAFWTVGKFVVVKSAWLTGGQFLFNSLRPHWDKTQGDRAQWTFLETDNGWQMEWGSGGKDFVRLEGGSNRERFTGDGAGTFLNRMVWAGRVKPPMSFLPWNVRQAIKTAIKDKNPNRFYVERFEMNPDGSREVIFKDHSVPLRNGLQNCAAFLSN